jgi:hypothetical protein
MPGATLIDPRPPTPRPRRTIERSPIAPRRVLVAAAIGGLALAAALPPAARGADGVSGAATGGAAPPGVAGKSTVVQDPAWLAAKAAHRTVLRADGRLSPIDVPGVDLLGVDLPTAVLPSAKRLVTTDTALVVEPPGVGRDDLGTSFVDANYWNFCAPGGATVAAYYFGSSRVTARPAGYYVEPYGPKRVRTYWASADTVSGYPTKGRSYLMYMAEQVFPPGWATPGLAEFSYYPTLGATLPDTRDALNWEISGHAPGWAAWYYAVQPTWGSRWSEAQLHADVAWDIGYDNRPIVAAVDTAYLPNWSRSLGHTIVIVGYDDLARTYTYLDTCGKACNGSAGNRNGGIYTVSQRAMYLAIASWGTGYLY